MKSRRVGLWMIGAHGGVATTVAVGLAALRQNLIGPAGLVTAAPRFSGLPLIGWEDLVLGGHEIRRSSAEQAARQLAQSSRAFDASLVDACREDLSRLDHEIRPGVLRHVGNTITELSDPSFSRAQGTAREIVSMLQNDLDEFVAKNELQQVVVVNLASTEPLVDPTAFPATWTELEKTLDMKNCALPSSSLYAIAALERGHPFVNFTPSIGSDLPAIDELAKSMNACHIGRDGKTGETFLKSVLAPAFAARNLEIMSWVGHNIFGNMDGQVLNDPANKATKVTSKDKLLGEILGYPPQTHISIEYIRSLGDWKTAWDHIHFRGFLGTPMIMQFTWQGCDSILAAPLVLDLVRLVDFAAQRGSIGTLDFLASFFKSPQGTNIHEFSKQFDMLLGWVDQQIGQSDRKLAKG